MVEVNITFDQPSKNYTNKDVISGVATVITTRDTSVTSIEISCLGLARVSANYTGNKTVDYVYFDQSETVFDSEGNSIKLSEGVHKYRFSYCLPDRYFPELLPTFAFKRVYSGNGIRWLVRVKINYPKIKLRRPQLCEKPFLFFPQYDPKKFTPTTPYLIYEFEDTFKGCTHLSMNKASRSSGLRRKLKANVPLLGGTDPTRQEVSVHCNIITNKYGVSQAPFSSGINLRMWAGKANFVLMTELVLTLSATQALTYGQSTEDSKFKYELARIKLDDVLPGPDSDPLSLQQILKEDGPFTINKALPGTFKSKFFSQSYTLDVDLTVESFYHRSTQKTFHFKQPVEVLHLWINPTNQMDVPRATFLEGIDAQIGLEGLDIGDEGLPAYPGMESPPDFVSNYSDLTPVVSPMSICSIQPSAPVLNPNTSQQSLHPARSRSVERGGQDPIHSSMII